MKIQSPAILAIGLVVSLTSAIAGSFSGTTGATDRVPQQMRQSLESRRPAAIDLERPTAAPQVTEVEHLASEH